MDGTSFEQRRRAPRFRIPEMEGGAARRYDRLRGTPAELAATTRRADELSAELRPGAAVLELAPGPGRLAIEMARRGHQLTGVDISHTMVEIARGHSAEAGVDVDFRHGDATRLPFPDDSFDLVVCQAAFKNFLHPGEALDEMCRVLRPGGVAVIDDLRRDAGWGEIRRDVRSTQEGTVPRLVTAAILWWLRRRARTASAFFELAERSAFGGCTIRSAGIGLEVRLTKAAG